MRNIKDRVPVINQDLIDARIKEINDAIQLLKDLMSKGFNKLTVYERLEFK